MDGNGGAAGLAADRCLRHHREGCMMARTTPSRPLRRRPTGAQATEGRHYSKGGRPGASEAKSLRKIAGDFAFGLAMWAAFAWLCLAYLGIA